MKYYKLIKALPFGYKIGTIKSEKELGDFAKIKEYWEEVKTETFKTYEGEEITLGDNYFSIDSNGSVSSNIFLSLERLSELHKPIFKNSMNANVYRDAQIDVQIENERVIGEDILLYGVVSKGNWQESTTRSRVLFYKGSKNPNWKYFRTEEERDNFILEHKPMFNLKFLKEVAKSFSNGSSKIEEEVTLMGLRYLNSNKENL